MGKWMLAGPTGRSLRPLLFSLSGYHDPAPLSTVLRGF